MTEMKGNDDKNHLSPYENGVAPAVSADANDTKSVLSCSRPSSAVSDVSTRIKFRLYTEDSWGNQLQKEEDKRKKEEKTGGIAEAHLVDGELKFDDDEEEAKKESDPKLKEGELLPPDLADVFRTDYYGKPLEEIDRFIKDKTFVAIAPRFGKKFIYRFTSTKTFYILPPWNPVRKLAVYIATNQFFDYLVITTILMNCVFLAMHKSAAAETAEYVFLGIYTIELVVKCIARGFILYRFTYLRDPWNWLDFIVIVSAYITIFIQAASPGSNSTNLQGLRTFRVFRALKTVSIVPGLKTIVNALLRAFKLLFEVIMLTTFCLMVFALFGLQIYKGVLRQKCVVSLPELVATPSLSIEAQFDAWVKNTSNWYELDGDYIVCGNASGSGKCPDNYTCMVDIGENPNFGYTNFDHFGWAMLASFQLITLDFWEDCYIKVIRASGPFHVAFFVVVVFFGSFYLINLMLAVVAMAYEEEADSTEAENEAQKQRAKDKDPLKELANATKAAAKWKPGGKEKSDLGETKGKDPDNKQSNGKVPEGEGESEKTVNGQNLVKYGKGRKPMVKMPSKDSGYSVQSSQSGGSKEKDGDTTSWDSIANKTADSGTGSLNHGLLGELPVLPSNAKRQNLIKQQSTDNISSSAIHLEKAGEYPVKKKKVGPEIILATGDGYKPARGKGQLIDRNCPCCAGTSIYTYWLYVQNGVMVFASDPLFDLFITVCIVLNTVFMAVEHHGMSDELKEVLRIANYIFTSIFTFECVVKLTALSKFYFDNGWNVFDFVIVIASLVDLGLEDVDGLSVFRSFRLLRVFKLAQSWPTLKLLLTIILSTLGALGYLTIVLVIVIYIFAVIGLQLFSDSYTEEIFGDDIPRWNFTDFFHAMLMVFRVLCGEWIEPLWDCMRAADELCMVVFLPTLVLGNFIVLNLFLALLLNAFASDTLDQEPNDEDNRLKLAITRIKNLCCCCLKPKRSASVGPNDKEEDGEASTTDKDSKDKDAKNKGKAEDKIALTNGQASTMKSKTDPVKNSTDTKGKPQANGTTAKKDEKSKDKVDAAFSTQREEFSSFNAALKANANDTKGGTKADDKKDKEKDDKKDEKKDQEEKDDDDLPLGAEASTTKTKKKEGDEEEEEVKVIVVEDCFPEGFYKVLYRWIPWFTWLKTFDDTAFGKKWYMLRKLMATVIENKVFEGIILFLIAVSSLTLAFEDVNLYENPTLELALDWLNIIFCVLFAIEMLMKWVGMGFKKYFTQFWTLLDFCIVVVSIASLAAKAAGVDNISAFRSLRTLRAFRPLRAISRWQGMRIVVNALMLAIPAICNVLVVCMVFWLIFSIMGVQFFSGKFFKCVDEDGERLLYTVTANKTECLAKNYTWQNSKITFDNVLSGYLALFQVATFEGWMEVMGDAIDATEVDEQPIFEAGLYYYLYFVAFIIFGAFFTLNLFIGVIIENFNALKKKYEGSYLDMFLTQGQRNYMNTLKKLANKKPQKTVKRPKGPSFWNSFQAVFYDVSVSSKFDLAIIIFIFLNMIIMAVDHYKMSDLITDILDIMNIVFTTVFTMECIVKIIGLRLHYFRQPWNVFDFVVVVLSLGGIILDQVLDGLIVSPTLLRVVRVFRIGRVLRLIKAAKGIRKLLFALIISLPALLNIGALLFLVMYIFAIIGMSSFGNVKIEAPLDDTVNFQTFGNSFVLLLRLSTSAGWNDILEPLLIEPPYCDPDYIIRTDGTKVESTNGDCGTPWLAYFFMVAYILVVFLIVINMYIAVILENFNQAHEQEEVGVTEDDFDEFYVVWEKFDPLATQYIKYEQLSTFVADLDPPLGIPKPNEIALVACDLPIMEGDKIHCLDVLIALVKNVLGRVEETEEFKELRAQMEEKFEETFPTRVNNGKMSSTMQKKKEDVAAKTLQRAWRSFKTQKQLRNITKLAMDKSKDDDDKKSKGGALAALGQRLSCALTNFFSGSSRPGSAASTRSVKSTDPGAGKTKVNKNTLQTPSVGALYNNQKDDSNKDVEL
ncbi:sodium channel protein 1 brain-like isoform X2 [Mizuhopecten yessoensis]|uniref:sodium channel protein 1 brain-like isoform X2 n=1 Tax=Mizuhopecten yessoensis TaxID=6573 RepID=UPI000B45AEA2|nr:sodium channel protein 1 brain-like isoform X2 [Mizuhopecten yessoensis]